MRENGAAEEFSRAAPFRYLQLPIVRYSLPCWERMLSRKQFAVRYRAGRERYPGSIPLSAPVK